MPDNELEDQMIYQVVMNHEEQYSIWPSTRDLPAGWNAAGPTGKKVECLEHIKQVWTDMRPLSLRKRMDAAQDAAETVGTTAGSEPDEEGQADDLVDRLAKGRHPIEVTLRPEKTIDALVKCIERNYVHIRFTGTRGGTELGVPLDRDRCDLAATSGERKGTVHFEGELSLNFRKVRCISDVDLETLTGQGHLVPLAP
jgi:uncharacterized protein YbdZ (MbtH family)